MRYGQLVIGPAGSGKSTYCSAIEKHCQNSNRRVTIVNLDPAAEHFDYEATIDVRELIQLEEVMEADEIRLGPNGGLVYCMEYLADNLDWLEDQLGDAADDDYFIFDCPGQIELFTHIDAIKRVILCLQALNFQLCAVFLLDTQFMLESNKFFSGCMVALSAMVRFEMPHVNVLSKMDLLTKENKEIVQSYLEPDSKLWVENDSTRWNKKFHKLTRSIASVLEDYSMIRFAPLDITSEDSITDVLITIDNCIQFGEGAEVKDRYPQEMDEEEREQD